MTRCAIDTVVASPAEMVALGVALAQLLAADDVVLLTGDLGAGKTQITKGIAAGLGTPDTVTSPTFNILIAHTGGRLPLYHIDLYRLTRPSELEDIDFYGTAESGGVTVVEWGDRFAEVKDVADLVVRIEITGDVERSVSIEALSDRGDVVVSSVDGE